jgi:hypothetical protein
MKKKFLIYLLFSLVSCKKNSENQDAALVVDTTAHMVDSAAIAVRETKTTPISSGLTLSERNEKLIGLCKSVNGTIDADVRGDILTVQFSTVEPEEAQKIAQGIFSTIKRSPENDHIKTVMVCDIDYKLLGYAGAKK